MKQFIEIVILTVLLSITAFSQKLTEMHIVGNAEFISSELIDKSIKDANGETCAGLIIQSDLTGLNYTSYNGIVKVNKNSGKDFLFLSPDERVVEVFCEGFASLKIILNDYGIKLESGKVWQLKITGEKKNISGLIPVNFLIEPTGAEIFINGESKGIESNIKLASGDYDLRIEKKGFKSIKERIKVTSDNTLFKYNLTAIDLIPIKIKSIPDKAQIFLDNQDNGITNNGLFLYPGTYKLRLVKSGYLDIEKYIEVTETGENEFVFSMVNNTGTLSVSVIPNGSEIFLNKEKILELPGSIDLAPRQYKIEIKKENYFSKEESFEIKQGEVVTRSYKLDEIKGNALIKINPIESECTLLRNGEVIENWIGLKNLKNIQIGSYVIQAKLRGYKKLSKEISVQENKTTIIDLLMEKGEDKVFVPIDKKNKTIKIGSQIWMTENLNVDRFRNGDIIPEANTKDEWENAGKNEKPVWCYYENKSENGIKYGRIYNWYAVNDKRGLSPDGWHIPTRSEFKTLKSLVDENGNSLKAMGESESTNMSGFSALSSACRNYNGIFNNSSYYTCFWSSTEYDGIYAYSMYILSDDSSIRLYSNEKGNGYCVRVLKN